ncbi:putative septum formation protein MAF like protein [Trypanosoma vivax]|nr:putative septum formation protein MAF like protein [Trypanosoma vivax]
MVLEYVEFLRQKKIVLASASPRRLEILKMIGLGNVQVSPSDFAEDLKKASFACGGDYALHTALHKANQVVRQLLAQAEGTGEQTFDILIAEDTVAVLPDESGSIEIIEKPKTSEEAAAMLRRFAGRRHEVWTGVAIAVNCDGCVHWRELSVRTAVEFRTLSDAEINAYVNNSLNWRGKTGGYGVQDTAACFLSAIDGDYYNVMGLPLNSLCVALDELIVGGTISGVR